VGFQIGGEKKTKLCAAHSVENVQIRITRKDVHLWAFGYVTLSKKFPPDRNKSDRFGEKILVRRNIFIRRV